MMFRDVFALFGLILLYAGILTGQTTTDKGKQLFDQAIRALGGDRFLHMQNRVATGRLYSFFREELSGLAIATIYTEYLPQAPANGVAIRERQAFGKKQDYSVLFLGDQAWDLTFRGARPISDEKWQQYLRSTENDIFYVLRVRYGEPGMQFDYIGTDVYQSTHIEVGDVTDAQNRTVRVYFDHNTLLPVHQAFSWMDPETRYHNEEVTEFDKYRDVGGGVMWPYAIERQRNGYKTYQAFADRIEINQVLPDKTFELPSGARVLKKVQ
jgi:hypothetical protein